MSSASVSGGTSAGKRPVVAILAVIGIVAIIVGVLYFVGGSALPHFMAAGSHVKKGGHNFRGGAAVVVGVVLLAGAWWTGKKK